MDEQKNQTLTGKLQIGSQIKKTGKRLGLRVLRTAHTICAIVYPQED
jgi:hypothetical protein